MLSVTLNFADWLEAIFWRSFWHIFWHSFWHIFWHSFWLIFWHSFWHLSDISFDILSDTSSDISFWHFFWHIFWHAFWHIFWHSFFHIFLTFLLTYLLAFFLTYQNQNLTSTASQKSRSANSIFTSHHAAKVISMTTLCLSQNACSSTHTPHASDRPAKRQLSPKMQKGLRCHNYISWRVQTMKPDACHCGSFTSSV